MDIQILGYLLSEECDAFNAYAGAMNLNASAVANLLILRELALDRLPGLDHYQRHHPRANCTKIVAHQSNDSTKRDFAAHAARHGLKPTAAAERLFRAELDEHWLEQSVRRPS